MAEKNRFQSLNTLESLIIKVTGLILLLITAYKIITTDLGWPNSKQPYLIERRDNPVQLIYRERV